MVPEARRESGQSRGVITRMAKKPVVRVAWCGVIEDADAGTKAALVTGRYVLTFGTPLTIKHPCVTWIGDLASIRISTPTHVPSRSPQSTRPDPLLGPLSAKRPFGRTAAQAGNHDRRYQPRRHRMDTPARRNSRDRVLG